jgi:PQQ-like domain
VTASARVRGATWASVLLAAMFLPTGCAQDNSEDSASGESADTGPQVVAVEDLLGARLTLTGDPDWLAADEQGLWVLRDSGELRRIDTTTHEVTGVVELGDMQLCSGLGASFGSVWSCLGPDVVRVDPEDLSVVKRWAIHKQAVQGHLVGAFDRVWVLTSDGSSLVGIDPNTNRVASEFELPARCSDIAAGADTLWMPCRLDDRVLEIDPATGDTLLDLPIDNPVSVAVDTDVWVGAATTTMRLDPETGEVLAEVDVGAEPEGGVALDPGSVWVRNGDDFLIEIDRASGTVVRRITADVTSGGDLLVLDGTVWTTANNDEQLFQIAPG